jgi:hypothetical protein
MEEKIMDRLLSEINRVKEIVKEYNSIPDNVGRLDSLFMQIDIETAEISIKENDLIKMLECYLKLTQYEL